jgi:hypothetical protein
MGGSLSSPFLLRKSISNHFSHANEKLCFTLHIDLGNPACCLADRAELFHREQTERHQGTGDQKITMTCQYKDEQARSTTIKPVNAGIRCPLCDVDA